MGALRQPVRDIFMKFNEPMEGRCNFMYLDAKRLVSTGVGNLIDPVASALSLPWLKPDMSPASQADVRAAWNAVKNDTTMNPANGGGQYKKLTTLRLTEGAIDKLIMARLDMNVTRIQKTHPGFRDWSADAQLAAMSMCWALGAASESKFPKFWAAMDRGDFLAAADECSISGAGTVVKRNLCNKLLLVNATRAKALGLDPAVLCWPKVLPPPTPTS